MLKLTFYALATIIFVNHYLNNCSSRLHRTLIRGIRISDSVPIFDRDTSFAIINEYEVYEYGNLRMYQFPYRYDSFVNRQLVFQEMRKSYFIFNVDSSYGQLMYENAHSRQRIGRLPVDSVINENTMETRIYDSLASRKPDSVLSNREANVIKVFNGRPTPNSPENFTLYFYYSKLLNDWDQTLSRKMDNIRGLKLFRIKGVAHGYYYKDRDIKLPRRDLVREMKPIVIANEDHILSYFEKYQKRK